MARNEAAWLVEAGKPLSLSGIEMPLPGPKDIVIRNRAVAINPIDAKQQIDGKFIRKYPHVLGQDVAGEVYAIGSDITQFAKGDRVIGHAWSLITGDATDGGFALFTKVRAGCAAIIPATSSFSDAVVLPLALDTAISGLYSPGSLNLPLPTTNPQPSRKVLIVYGGSSSVGLSVIQLAAASGVRTIAIASSGNHALCKAAGASHTIDYNDANFVLDTVAAVGDDRLAGIYDAISNTSTFKNDIAILEKLGGGILACTHEMTFETQGNITTKAVFGAGDFSFPVWQTFIPEALASGQLKYLPAPVVVGEGLESIMSGLERYKAGVSGQKLIIQL